MDANQEEEEEEEDNQTLCFIRFVLSKKLKITILCRVLPLKVMFLQYASIKTLI